MPIGGLREKSMAAYRENKKIVIIPKENEPDLYEVDPIVKAVSYTHLSLCEVSHRDLSSF